MPLIPKGRRKTKGNLLTHVFTCIGYTGVGDSDSGGRMICVVCNFCLPSVLWCCWLGGRKGIRPVKNWVVGCCRGYLSGAGCRRVWPSWCHCHSLSLASVKSRLVLPFWYRLTRVVPEKGPLNGCVCVCVCVCHYRKLFSILTLLQFLSLS